MDPIATEASQDGLTDWCNIFQRGATANQRLGWVPEPGYRGSLGIVWTCLLVVFTCTWTVMHINVPGPRETTIDIFLRKLKWAVFIVYAPEVMTLIAACQWQSARLSRQAMGEMGIQHWTLAHGFFADSGGFSLVAPDERPFPVNTRAIQYLVSKGYIPCPSTTADEIWDKSKSDHFAKAAAVIQMGYLFFQVIARAVMHLQITPLEIVTVAFCICALTTSVFWANKPKDVNVAIRIYMDTPLSQVLCEAGSRGKSYRYDTPMDFVEQPGWSEWNRRAAFRSFGGLKERPIQRIPNDYITPPATLRMALFTWFITVLHPAIHLLEWNFEFPSVYELYVWRIACASLLAVLFVWGIAEVLLVKPGFDFTMTLLGIWVKETTQTHSWLRHRALDVPGAASSMLYFVARTIILVETIVCLRQMPFSVYQTVEFPQYIPHFA